jgi:hypothetical protein
VLYQLSYVSNSYIDVGTAVPLRGGAPSNLCRAGDGARTRDIKLGRLALYQLSYSRSLLFSFVSFNKC